MLERILRLNPHLGGFAENQVCKFQYVGILTTRIIFNPDNQTQTTDFYSNKLRQWIPIDEKTAEILAAVFSESLDFFVDRAKLISQDSNLIS